MGWGVGLGWGCNLLLLFCPLLADEKGFQYVKHSGRRQKLQTTEARAPRALLLRCTPRALPSAPCVQSAARWRACARTLR